jgi:hypothetical protein
VRFRRRLADRLSELDAGATVLVEVEGEHRDSHDGCTPYMHAFLDDEETRLVAFANRFLHPQHRISKEERGACERWAGASPRRERSGATIESSSPPTPARLPW